MIKRNMSYILAFSVMSMALSPFMANASLLKINDDERAEVSVALRTALIAENNQGDNSIRSNNSIRGEASLKSNDDDKSGGDNRKNSKSNSKENKDNRGSLVSWFARFFNKTDADTKAGIRISAVNERVGTSTALVNWKTKEETKGKVYFSTDSNLSKTSTTTGLSFVEETVFSLEHKTTLSNLSVSTKYYYFIEYQGTDGRLVRSKVYEFKTKEIMEVDATAPKILFSTAFRITDISANIVWVTDESSNSKLWVSTTTPIDTTKTPTQVSGGMGFWHSLTLSNLATSTTYFYVVGSTDVKGNTVLGAEGSFKTLVQ